MFFFSFSKPPEGVVRTTMLGTIQLNDIPGRINYSHAHAFRVFKLSIKASLKDKKKSHSMSFANVHQSQFQNVSGLDNPSVCCMFLERIIL